MWYFVAATAMTAMKWRPVLGRQEREAQRPDPVRHVSGRPGDNKD